MSPITEVAVVVPARDEEGSIDGCLEALAAARERISVPTRIVVVPDSCRDGTADACARFPVEVIPVDFANVGRARHVGVSHAIVTAGGPADTLWIGNTDADSRVAPDWMVEQLALADEGADVILGLTDIDTDIPPSARDAYQAGYRRRIRGDGSHRHVHGANFGIRASTYLAVGGFPPLANHEDRQLVLRVRAMLRATVVSSTQVMVTTSGRTDGRCQEGVARSIADLSRQAREPTPLDIGRPA
jgi:glycosyltransferase involved in cell wall biosynthesis